MACYLRAWGEAFDVDGFLSHSSLHWDPVWHKGEPKKFKRSGEVHEQSGVTTLAGAGDELQEQVHAAIMFLRENREEVERLVGSPGLEGAVLDFGISWDDHSAARFFRFPLELVHLAAASGLELELSVYDFRRRDVAPL